VDTPTQALLGAVVGQAGFSHKLGKRALWWGALGGAIPDFDLLPITRADELVGPIFRPQTIERIDLVKGSDQTAPVVMAITVEVAP